MRIRWLIFLILVGCVWGCSGWSGREERAGDTMDRTRIQQDNARMAHDALDRGDAGRPVGTDEALSREAWSISYGRL